ncbi:MAG: helix-turn-helix transcriptional regulator [Planctomycetes bacterium]|nr:helix-turn-helix transcriptional regulator [Planctomycetota bacterium]
MTTNNILKRFARNVKTLRLKNGWTQEELAHRADVHRTYIGSIERHERNVSLLNVERIASAFKVNARDLI